MKKIFTALMVVLVASGLVFAIDYSDNKFGGTLGKKISWGRLFVHDNITYKAQGGTYYTEVGATAATANRAITFPNASGSIPVVINASQTSTTNNGVDNDTITGSTVTFAAGQLAAGDTLEWQVSGSKVGANDNFTLSILGGSTRNLTLTSGSAAAVDWRAVFTYAAVSATSQKLSGCLYRTGVSPICDYATASDNGTAGVTVGLQIGTLHANDNASADMVRTIYFRK